MELSWEVLSRPSPKKFSWLRRNWMTTHTCLQHRRARATPTMRRPLTDLNRGVGPIHVLSGQSLHCARISTALSSFCFCVSHAATPCFHRGGLWQGNLCVHSVVRDAREYEAISSPLYVSAQKIFHTCSRNQRAICQQYANITSLHFS